MVKAVDSIMTLTGELVGSIPFETWILFSSKYQNLAGKFERDEAPSKSLIRIPFLNLPIKFEFEPLSF